MAEFAARYAAEIPTPRRLLDVGSWDQNGTFRKLFDDWEYVGLDIHEGLGVDYVPADPYVWPELPSDHFNLVISGSCLEHVEFPWATFREVARVLRRGGLLCAIAPSKGKEHRVPLDCWRYYPDGMRALAKWAGLQVVDVTWDRNRAHKWNDVRLIARKP